MTAESTTKITKITRHAVYGIMHACTCSYTVALSLGKRHITLCSGQFFFFLLSVLVPHYRKNNTVVSQKGPWAVHLTLGSNGGGGVGQYSSHQYCVLLSAQSGANSAR